MAEYEFGIASLVNKKELLQVGDPVQFQLHVGEDFAVNIQATREKLRSYVEAMKGECMLLQNKVLIYKFLEQFRGGHTGPRKKINFFGALIQKAHEYILNLRRQLSSSILSFVWHRSKLGLI